VATGIETAMRRQVLGTDEVAALAAWATDIESWPAGSHVWGHYAEATAEGPAICRTENVSACHAGVARLSTGVLRDLATELLGEPATDFKDKLNYKQPGGAGFLPHQDARAYPGVARVVSLLVAIDECSETSGCLWLASGVDEVLAVDERGVVRDEVCAALQWRCAELAPGDAVCIDGFAPHYSDANLSDAPRRVLVTSFTPTGSGYDRATYYTRRSESMRDATERDGRFRISTLADFAGVEVAPESRVAGACTHPAPL
jgi:hypothetical protein